MRLGSAVRKLYSLVEGEGKGIRCSCLGFLYIVSSESINLIFISYQISIFIVNNKHFFLSACFYNFADVTWYKVACKSIVYHFCEVKVYSI